MKKAYLSILRVIVILLAFVLGMVSSLVLLIGAGYFVANNVSLSGLEGFGIVIDTSNILDEENANTPIRSLTIMELLGEMSEISSLAETKTLDYLSKEYGLIIPADGESELFDAMRALTLSQLFSQEGLDTAMSNVYVGELLGYEKRTDAADPEQYYWFDPIKGADVVGVESLLADYTVHKLVYEGVVVSDLIDGEPVGTFIGYTKNNDGVWVDKNGAPLTGPMKFIAGKKLNEVGASLNEVTVGELLGYSKIGEGEDAKWVDSEGNQMSGAMKAFADNKLSNIEDGIGEAEIGTILGYEKDASGWYKMDGETRVPLTGTMLAFADDTLDTLQTGIDSKNIGIMLGYTEVEGVWYDEDNQPVSGAMKAMASMTLGEVGGENGISATKIGILLGYDNIGTEDVPVWQKDGSDVTGVMKAMANKTFNNVGELESEKIGNLLGYQFVTSPANPDYPEGYWVNPGAVDPEAPCSAFVQIMSNATFENIDTLQDTITIGKLIPVSERTGFLAIMNENTAIDDISDEVTRVFETASIKELHENGALDLDEDDVAKLSFLGVYEEGSINNCLSTILDGIPVPTP